MPSMKTTLEDDLKSIDILDFTGGLNSITDLFDLDLTQSPDCLNVYAEIGRLVGRKGSQSIVTMSGTSDGIMQMYDALGSRRKFVWNNGNLVETTFGTEDIKATGSYNAGNRVCHTVLNGIIYYSDGIIPIRQYDPITGVDSDITPDLSRAGAIPVPSANVLITYTGALVAGACVAAGVFEPQQFRWCDINNPSVWIGANVQAVGQGVGGQINAMSNMGVSDAGVSPFRSLLVGKSQEGVYGYQGALGQLQEFLIPVPSGVQDGASMVFIPSPDGKAMVTWLGTDRKVWYSNGVTCAELSGPIRTELAEYVQNQIVTKGQNALFCGVNNAENFHYVLDCGDNTQYVYDYQNKYWTRYNGWPSGYWASGADNAGFPAIFFASNTDTKYGQANVGVTEFDGTTPITHYWKTPYLGAGNHQRLKDFIQAFVAFRTQGGGQVDVAFVEGPTPTPDARLSTSYRIAITPDGGNYLIWDVGNWDDNDWAPNPDDQIQTYQVKNRIACVVAGDFADLIPFETFKAANCQVTIGQSEVASHFEILQFKLQYIWRGYAQVGQVG